VTADADPGETPRAPWAPGLIVVGAILLAAVGWFLVYDAWWVNSDGSAYLSLGRSFVDGHGFRLPDGEVLAWWNRPAYPVLLTAPWLVRESLEASIWMSRVPLILAAPIVAAGTLRFTRSLVAAALAGVVAIAQPWTLLAGGSNLVPDGLVAMAVVSGVLAASLAVVAATKRARVVWLVVAVLAVVLASLAKETGAVGFLLVGIVVWNGLARPRRSRVLTALAATIPVVVAALVVANADTDTALIDLPQEFADQMRDETFAGSWWIVVAAIMALVLIVWAIPRATEPLPLAGLALVAPALALGLYASGTGLGMRNAALLPYGIAFLLGAFVSSELGRRTGLAARSVVAVVGFALVVALLSGSKAREWSPTDVADRNWDSAATRSVADYLSAHRDDGRAACTLLFCSFYWLAADGDVDLALLPQYSARPGAASLDDLDFTKRAGFRGPESATPPCTGVPLVVTKSDEGFGAIFECALLDYIRETKPRYLVVSGSDGSDTFDAGRLIPYLEANPAFRRVYSSTAAELPRVVAVYEVVGDPQPVRGAPAYYSASAYEALPGDHDEPGVTVLDGACYAETIQAILARPPGTGAPPVDAEPGSCVDVSTPAARPPTALGS
jgi:hypothetical protein